MRRLEELIEHQEPGIELIRDWLADAETVCELLPPSSVRGECLHQLQVTTRSPMGALVYDSGGLLVDHGWLRFLGSGHPRLSRDLPGWNRRMDSEGFLLVADDVLGGFFAVNGGGLGDERGGVYYLPYDGLDWESLGVSFSQFLAWSFTPALEGFYGGARWEGWQDDVKSLSGDQCFSFFPFLWTEEGSVSTSSRATVSLSEAYELKMEIRRQLLADGS